MKCWACQEEINVYTQFQLEARANCKCGKTWIFFHHEAQTLIQNIIRYDIIGCPNEGDSLISNVDGSYFRLNNRLYDIKTYYPLIWDSNEMMDIPAMIGRFQKLMAFQ